MKSLTVVLLLCSTSWVAAQDSQTASQRFTVENNVAVPMRDGIVLRADVLRPAAAGKFPVLVYRTPYGKDAAQQEYTTFQHAVERGSAGVIMDGRGRYHSDGGFRLFKNEGGVGYET